MRLSPIQLLLSLLALAPVAQAQTTHDVMLLTSTFSPKNLTIEVGDTVRWTWVNGFHNCTSGIGGTPDMIWDSGFQAAPYDFSVTFDQAFIDANPVNGNRYDYYCTIHLPGMTGSITVNAPEAGEVKPYGTNLNPAGSLIANGTPAAGSSIGLRVRNPLDSSAGPGFGVLFLSTSPDPSFPGGTVLPGFGLSPNPTGAILISLSSPNPVLSLGPQDWVAGGNVDFFLPIPNDPVLVGQSLFAQGALVDIGQGGAIGLTSALELVIG
ncbi:MAG: cupredoxin domain-containing protein [Planctomycetota bacterium]|jgi:plastocyanin